MGELAFGLGDDADEEFGGFFPVGDDVLGVGDGFFVGVVIVLFSVIRHPICIHFIQFGNRNS